MPNPPAVLLPVPLDGVGVANVRLVRVGTRIAQRTALTQQVPATIQLDLDGAQSLLVGLQAIRGGAVGLLAIAKLVLLGDEALDARRDALVAHLSIVTVWPRSDSLRSRRMSRAAALIDEVANELATWPGVRIERRADGAALVRYEHAVLGVLYPDDAVAELPVLGAEHDELLEHGEAEGADLTPHSSGVSHDVRGPSDVTAVLELFDRRYRDIRGEDDPPSSTDPG